MSDVKFNPPPTVLPTVTPEAPTTPPINNDSASCFDSPASVGNIQADFDTAAEEIMANAEILEAPEPEPLPNFEECIPQFEEDARDEQGDFENYELTSEEEPQTNYDITSPSDGDVQADFDNSNISQPEVKDNKLPEHSEKDGLMVKTNHAEKDGLLAKTEKTEKRAEEVRREVFNEDGSVNFEKAGELFSQGKMGMREFISMCGQSPLDVMDRSGGFEFEMEDGTIISGDDSSWRGLGQSLYFTTPDGQEYSFEYKP